jgi:hypothetical protein
MASDDRRYRRHWFDAAPRKEERRLRVQGRVCSLEPITWGCDKKSEYDMAIGVYGRRFLHVLEADRRLADLAA